MHRLFFFSLFLLGAAVLFVPTMALGSSHCGTWATPPCSASTSSSASGITIPTDTGLSSMPVAEILEGLMNWLLGIFGFIAIIGFIISGLQYFLAAGDEKMAETAKRNMQYSIVGIIVALSGYVIIQAIDNALNNIPEF